MEFPIIGKVKNPAPWIIGAIAASILAIGGTTYFALNRSKPAVNLEKLTVQVKAQTLRLQITASGTVVPVQTVNLSPKTSGRLSKLYVEQGDRVQQGQLIAQMDNADIEAQLIQARANVAQAQARLAEAANGSRPEEIAQASARLAQAQARLAEAQRGRPEEIAQAQAQVDSAQGRVRLTQERLRDYESLAKQGAVTLDKLAEVKADNNTAEANLREAQQRLRQAQQGGRIEQVAQLQAAAEEARQSLRQLQNGTRSEQIAQLRAAVVAAQGQVQVIQEQLENTIIRAPFSGVVTQKYATEGAFVTPTTTASSTASATSTSIVAIAKGLEVLAKVPEVDIGQIIPGQSVEIVADAYPDKVFPGKVRLVSPEAVVDQSVTSFQVRVSLDNGKDLRSGMNVDLTFLGKEVDNALVVPTVAIVTEKGKTGVMIVNSDNKPKFKAVTIGSSVQDQTQVLEGLNEGDRVFIDLPKDQKPKEGS
jgi:HlyD family secretion protein